MRAAELGLGVHEMKSYVAQADLEQWVPLVDWLAAGSRDAGADALPGGSTGGTQPGATAAAAVSGESAAGWPMASAEAATA